MHDSAGRGTGNTTTRHDDGDGRHNDGKGQNGDWQHNDGDRRHNDGKGQQGDGQHNNGDRRYNYAARRWATSRRAAQRRHGAARR